MPIANPYRLNRALADRIVQHVQEGQYLGIAAQLGGIPERTWKHWMAWAREGLELLEEEHGSLARLALRLERARAEAVSQRVKRVQDAGAKWWQER